MLCLCTGAFSLIKDASKILWQRVLGLKNFYHMNKRVLKFINIKIRNLDLNVLKKTAVAVRNSYTGRFTAASIWEILSLAVLLTRGPRRTSTHKLTEHEDCIKGEQKFCSQISCITYISCDTLGASGSSCYKILKTTEKSPKHNPCKSRYKRMRKKGILSN